VKARAGVAAATVSVNDCGSDPALFVAVIVNVADPAEVGVPESTPVAASSRNPAGSAPADTANVIGPVPEALMAAEYAVPTTAPANVIDVDVIDGATAAAVTVYVCWSDPALLVAVTVNIAGPTVVGVPDTTPEVSSNFKPAGNAPADTAKVGAGVPDAEIVER
jgi:hypothetical protein